MIGSDHRAPAAPDPGAFHFQRRLVVAMIEAENGQHAGKGSRGTPVANRAIAFETLLEEPGGDATGPLVEVADDDARSAQPGLREDIGPDEDFDLAASFEIAGSEMHIKDIHVQGATHFNGALQDAALF